MKNMREIVEQELQNTDALAEVHDKMPSEFWDELVDLVLQKMSWAYRRGQDDANAELGQS